MIEIRRMRPEDLEQVERIEADTFSQPWTRAGFLSSLEADSTIYLTVWEKSEIVGYCGLMKVLEEGDITNVAVKREFRGRGIGRMMLENLLKLAGEQGVREFTLEVRKSNAAAIALYKKLGFQDCGLRKNFYEKPVEDAVIMWKR
ncbi:MAG: ribosomal protein S18-alanine N-acetyltransferase [Eubacteriales bacterium]|nr:ribosomal protein S18-alanine N-acetyltransferase [Eubacteriales bacterium]